MADVVVDRDLVQHHAFQVIPAHDHRVDIKRGVDHTLGRIKLTLEMPESAFATLDFLPQKTVTRLEVLRTVARKFLETLLEKPVVVRTFRMPASKKTHAVL